jgi:hypothetical protein
MHWWAKSWEIGGTPSATDYGTPEGGSPGSPLFNFNKQIIGQFYGGNTSCTNSIDDYFGALWVSFPALEQYLTGGNGDLQMNGAYLSRV